MKKKQHFSVYKMRPVSVTMEMNAFVLAGTIYIDLQSSLIKNYISNVKCLIKLAKKNPVISNKQTKKH